MRRLHLSEPIYWTVLVMLFGALMFVSAGEMMKFGAALTTALILLHLREKLE